MSKPETNVTIEFEVVPIVYVTCDGSGLITVGQVHSQVVVVGVAVLKVVVAVAVVPAIEIVSFFAVVTVVAVVKKLSFILFCFESLILNFQESRPVLYRFLMRYYDHFHPM